MKAKKTFEQWMQEVNQEVEKKIGLDTSHLPDCPYRDWYENRMGPKAAATKAIKNMW